MLYRYAQKLIDLHTLTLKMEAACTFEMSKTSPTTTWCSKSKTELASIINYCESLKSLIIYFCIVLTSELSNIGKVHLFTYHVPFAVAGHIMTIGGPRLSIAAARPVTSEVEQVSLNKARINVFGILFFLKERK
jgi:hypothetical protein